MQENNQKQPSEYFTKEVAEKMVAMSPKQMTQSLRELEGTQYWTAILKYNQARLGISQSAILTADPHEKPGLISQNQGIMLGLSDMQNAVIGIVFNDQQIAAEAAQEAEAEKAAGTDVE